MKKILYLTFAVLLLSVMCFNVVPARAADVTFKGEWRVRGFAFTLDGTKYSPEQSKTTTYWDQRFRLYITAKVSENLKGVIRMLSPNHVPCVSESGNKWGLEDAENPKGVFWDIAYLDFDVPNTRLNVKVGRLPIDLGNYVVLGSCSTFDSLILSSSIQNVNFSLLTVKLDEGNPSNSGVSGYDDEDLYGLVLDYAPAQNMAFSGYFVLGMDADTQGLSGDDSVIPNIGDINHPDLTAFWLGATADLEYNIPLKIKLEFDYSKLTLDGINNQPDWEFTGFAIYADVSSEVGGVDVGGNLLYTTGHDFTASNQNDSDLFVPISSYFSERHDYDYLVLREFIFRDYSSLPGVNFTGNGVLTGNYSIGNITAIQLYGMKALNPQVDCKLSAQKYWFTEDPDGTGTNDKDLGYEIDVKLTYKPYTNLAISGIGAIWFVTDDVFGPDNEDNWLLKHEILYKF